MRCPKDADELINYYEHTGQGCNAETISPKEGTVECTRKKGHQGKHHVHLYNGKCIEIWD